MSLLLDVERHNITRARVMAMKEEFEALLAGLTADDFHGCITVEQWEACRPLIYIQTDYRTYHGTSDNHGLLVYWPWSLWPARQRRQPEKLEQLIGYWRWRYYTSDGGFEIFRYDEAFY